MMMRLLFLMALSLTYVSAEMPRGAWWNNELSQGLNLTGEQRAQIRRTVVEYRPKLAQHRAAAGQAERDLEAVFNREPVNGKEANDAIERLATSRADLTRDLSQMTWRLRSVLNQQQWQEVQRRFQDRQSQKKQGANPPFETQ